VKDHNFIREDGSKVTVSEMTIDEILGCLFDGAVHIEQQPGDPPSTTSNSVLERLRIEVLIREKNL
jgi:hypothetical protein